LTFVGIASDDVKSATEDPNIVCVFPDDDPPTAKIIVLHGIESSRSVHFDRRLKDKTSSTAADANADNEL